MTVQYDDAHTFTHTHILNPGHAVSTRLSRAVFFPEVNLPSALVTIYSSTLYESILALRCSEYICG